MKKKLYLDTSVISSLFDNKNPERQLLTEEFFKNIKNNEIYISDLTKLEINKTTDIQLKEKFIKTILGFKVLNINDNIKSLSKLYLDYGAVPANNEEDSLHIAVAVSNGMDYILSWNFRHIVRNKTRDIVRMVNSINGYRNIEIITPPEIF